MYQVSQIVISPSIYNLNYRLLDCYSRQAKLLYNAALFRVRQIFTGWDKPVRTDHEKGVFAELDLLHEKMPGVKVRRKISYNALEKLMRVSENPDFFSGLPMQTAQDVLKAAVQDFDNWLAALRSYKADPSRFLGRPRMPGYCRSDVKTFTITNQDAALYPVRNGDVYAGCDLKLPKFGKRIRLTHIPEGANLREVKVCPYYGKYLLILNMAVEDVPLRTDMPNLAGIDFGTENIAAVVTTDGSSRVYKGGAVKAENRLFHKEKGHATAIITAGTTHKGASSRHLDFLSRKHDSFMHDAMHKISSSIIEYCVQHKVGTIVMGVNLLWKQKSNMKEVNNQNFVSIPHARLRRMITYKAQTAGIAVIEQEESYTSKADCTAGDYMPVFGAPGSRQVRYSGWRARRGLYHCSNGLKINADCNGAANILRKALPDAWKGRTDYTFLRFPESIDFRKLNRRRAAA